MPLDTSVIAATLNGLVESASNESRDMYSQLSNDPLVQQASEAVKKGDTDGFFFTLPYLVEQLITGIVEKELPNNPDAQFLMANSHFIECHMDKLFSRFEGMACSHDKTRTVMRELMRFFNTGQKIEFNFSQQYTFHLPTKVLNTHEKAVRYFKALQFIYYGNPDLYLQEMDLIRNEY